MKSTSKTCHKLRNFLKNEDVAGRRESKESIQGRLLSLPANHTRLVMIPTLITSNRPEATGETEFLQNIMYELRAVSWIIQRTDSIRRLR